MKDKYQHIFFDLDHTLWDYDCNAREALSELYQQYGLQNYRKFSADQLCDGFFRANSQLWELYDLGKIEREHLRQERFRSVFRDLGFTDMDLAFQFGEDYVELCPRKKTVMPGAIALLQYLSEKYTIHVITNGFHDVQSVKIESSGLAAFFSEVITSERAGARKPAKEIFDYALKITGASKHNAVMIGDNLLTDIAGARKSEIDHIYFNCSKHAHSEPVTLEVHSLEELMTHL